MIHPVKTVHAAAAAFALAALHGLATETVAQVAALSGTVVVTNKTPSTATIIDVASGRTSAQLAGAANA